MKRLLITGMPFPVFFRHQIKARQQRKSYNCLNNVRDRIPSGYWPAFETMIYIITKFSTNDNRPSYRKNPAYPRNFNV